MPDIIGLTLLARLGRRSIHKLIVAGLTGGLVAAALPVRAVEESGASQFVAGLGDKVVGILKEQGLSAADRQTKFKTLFVSAFDAAAIARFVLGRHWKELSDNRRPKFMETFTEYVAALYATQFSQYQGQTLKVTGSKAVGEGDTEVDSVIKQPNNPTALNVQFRVRQSDGGYKVIDVAVNNVSLIITKRSEFNSIIQSEGIDGLEKRMHEALTRVKGASLKVDRHLG